MSAPVFVALPPPDAVWHNYGRCLGLRLVAPRSWWCVWTRSMCKSTRTRSLQWS